jgi:hypothetical protein
MGYLMVSNRGFVPNKERVVIRCENCWRKFTKFMSIRLYQHKEIYKCISCYNKGRNLNG